MTPVKKKHIRNNKSAFTKNLKEPRKAKKPPFMFA